MDIDKTILEYLTSLPTPAIIAISGFGGSGKSSAATILSERMHAPVIGIDAFIKDKTMTDYSLWNFMDYGRLEQEVLIPFNENKNPIHYGYFDWEQNRVTKQIEISHNGRLIIEGVGLFRPEFLSYFAYTIWIDCPIEEAIRRGKKRDRELYQYPQDALWEGIWKRNDEECFISYKPKEIAHYIIDNSATPNT